MIIIAMLIMEWKSVPYYHWKGRKCSTPYKPFTLILDLHALLFWVMSLVSWRCALSYLLIFLLFILELTLPHLFFFPFLKKTQSLILGNLCLSSSHVETILTLIPASCHHGGDSHLVLHIIVFDLAFASKSTHPLSILISSTFILWTW